MGYYVRTVNWDWVVPARYLDDAYEAVCKLNERHEAKRGGHGPIGGRNGLVTEWDHQTGESVQVPYDPYKHRWFSWMDPNYPETTENLADVLEMLGFEVQVRENGDLAIGYYDNKTGQEELFLAAIAPYSLNGSMIEWEGEDGDRWKYVVENGRMRTLQGEVQYRYAD